jgi:hypothetical protein
MLISKYSFTDLHMDNSNAYKACIGHFAKKKCMGNERTYIPTINANSALGKAIVQLQLPL